MKKLMTLLVFGALLAGMSGCHVAEIRIDKDALVSI